LNIRNPKFQDMNILIAPNAFKNSLTATQVAVAIEQGLKLSKLKCDTTCFPIADGGDGTGSLIIESCKGEVIYRQVHDPLSRIIDSSFGLIDNGQTAIIEMADASGLRLLKNDERDPLKASSYGTGELIKFALDAGVNKIILAMGGSATVDGGCGILNALGISFFNPDGDNLPALPGELINLVKIDDSLLDKRIFDCELVILCDVNNKLSGQEGAAAVFGPQKGATTEQVQILDGFLKNFASITEKQFGINVTDLKYGGAAGGAAAGLHAYLNAKLVDGIDYFLSLTGFDNALQDSNVVITGEGSIDRQTLQGKGPYGVAMRAKKLNILVIGLAGNVPLKPDDELQQYFDVLISINNEAVELPIAMANTQQNLIRTATIIGNLIALNRG
jgi:glycerate kinase